MFAVFVNLWGWTDLVLGRAFARLEVLFGVGGYVKCSLLRSDNVSPAR